MPQAQAHIVQECGVGLVRLRRDGPRLAFAAPPLIRSGPLPEDEVQRIARGLGLARSDIVRHAWCDNGPRWRGVLLASAEQVLALQPDAAMLAGLDVGVAGARGKVGVIGAQAPGTGTDADTDMDTHFEVRAFFSTGAGVLEDPVTGSLNAALAQWLIGAGLAPDRYVAAQGTALAREGRVHIERAADGTVWVGGASVTCIAGTVQL